MKQPTQQQIDELKTKHGELFKIEMGNEWVIITNPLARMSVMRQAVAALQSGGMTSYTEAIINNCYVAGDQALLKNEAFLNGIEEQITEIATAPDPEVTPRGVDYEVTAGEHRIVCRAPTRADRKAAHKANPKRQPFVTNEKMLEYIARDKATLTALKRDVPAYIAVLSAIDDLREKKAVHYSKL